jgi:hypothetical protein
MVELLQFKIVVHYEGGTTKDVTAGQRELAAWELERGSSAGEALRSTPHAFTRFLAYHRLKSQRRLATTPDGGFEGFDAWDARVIECRDPEPEPGEDASVVGDVDPTDPGPPPGT